MHTRRVHLRVRGTVQGVSFRASTRARAIELGLSGWVRNEPCDWSAGEVAEVTLEAQGDSAAVEELIAWCRRGPSLARVTEVSATEVGAVDGERSFVVAPTPAPSYSDPRR